RVLGMLRVLRVLLMLPVIRMLRMRRAASRRRWCLGGRLARHHDAAPAVNVRCLVQISQEAEGVYFVETFHHNPLTVVSGGVPHVVVSVSGGGRANGGRGRDRPVRAVPASWNFQGTKML